MKFDTALKVLNGQSVGGQLIVVRDGKHTLVGKYHDGELLLEDTDAARALAAEVRDAALEPVREKSRRGLGRKPADVVITGDLILAAAEPEPPADAETE